MTTAVDVNQEMFNQRTAAMAGNGVVRNDAGQLVGTGFDAGEVFGKDGLDLTSGEAALYTTVPAWHGLGTVVPGGIRDLDEVMKIAHLDWDVSLRPARFLFDGESHVVPDKFVTVREDTGAPLGIVGKVYTPLQNRDSFAFLQELVESYSVVFESAGALAGGRRTFVSLRLPNNIVVDADGIADGVIPFLAALNSHDGTTPVTAVVTPWRPICKNTERLAVTGAFTKWTTRHTSGAADRLAEARRTLGLTSRYYERFGIEETELARTLITIDEVRALLPAAILSPAETATNASERTRRNGLDKIDAVLGLFGVETERVGSTAYAAERAVTGYLDHHSRILPGTRGEAVGRAERLLTGTHDEIKDRTHRRLMLLRTR